eukprot:SAG11_NODE_7221_length_1176_cov_1.651811_1_plen_219_part_10
MSVRPATKLNEVRSLVRNVDRGHATSFVFVVRPCGGGDGFGPAEVIGLSAEHERRLSVGELAVRSGSGYTLSVVVGRCYFKGEQLAEGESHTCEFKSLLTPPIVDKRTGAVSPPLEHKLLEVVREKKFHFDAKGSPRLPSELRAPNQPGSKGRKKLAQRAGRSGYSYVQKYMCSFLNAEGGRILFGVNDDGVVEAVPIDGARPPAEPEPEPAAGGPPQG